MKAFLRTLPLFCAFILFSCTKEDVSPSNPSGPASVQVEYRVSAASGNVTIYQMVPQAGTNALTEEKVEVNRTTYSTTFTVYSGTEVSVRATNTNPGSEEVIAEIYVNGDLLASGNANAPAQYATATGTAR